MVIRVNVNVNPEGQQGISDVEWLPVIRHMLELNLDIEEIAILTGLGRETIMSEANLKVSQQD